MESYPQGGSLITALKGFKALAPGINVLNILLYYKMSVAKLASVEANTRDSHTICVQLHFLSNVSFTNGPIKLECYNTLGWKSLLVTNTPTY
jgi:hypothetical protein